MEKNVYTTDNNSQLRTKDGFQNPYLAKLTAQCGYKEAQF